MCTVLRKCLDCGLEANTEEDLSLFQSGNVKSKYGKQNLCYSCGRIRAEKYRDENREKARESAREWNRRNKDKCRDNGYKSKYGITLEDYNMMFDEQGGCCTICKQHQSNFKKRLVVDHCHASLNVRGLLCDDCNKGLGNFKDDIQSLYSAIEYLSREVEKEVNKKKNEMGI